MCFTDTCGWMYVCILLTKIQPLFVPQKAKAFQMMFRTHGSSVDQGSLGLRLSHTCVFLLHYRQFFSFKWNSSSQNFWDCSENMFCPCLHRAGSCVWFWNCSDNCFAQLFSSTTLKSSGSFKQGSVNWVGPSKTSKTKSKFLVSQCSRRMLFICLKSSITLMLFFQAGWSFDHLFRYSYWN